MYKILGHLLYTNTKMQLSIYTSANSVDPDQMLHYVAVDLGLKGL